jgi:hypothetical protein
MFNSTRFQRFQSIANTWTPAHGVQVPFSRLKFLFLGVFCLTGMVGCLLDAVVLGSKPFADVIAFTLFDYRDPHAGNSANGRALSSVASDRADGCSQSGAASGLLKSFFPCATTLRLKPAGHNGVGSAINDDAGEFELQFRLAGQWARIFGFDYLAVHLGPF